MVTDEYAFAAPAQPGGEPGQQITGGTEASVDEVNLKTEDTHASQPDFSWRLH